jgi:hypothetical protein
LLRLILSRIFSSNNSGWFINTSVTLTAMGLSRNVAI